MSRVQDTADTSKFMASWILWRVTKTLGLKEVESEIEYLKELLGYIYQRSARACPSALSPASVSTMVAPGT